VHTHDWRLCLRLLAIQYAPPTAFRQDLETEVTAYFARQGVSRQGGHALWVKTAVLGIWLAGSYGVLVFVAKQPWQILLAAASLLASVVVMASGLMYAAEHEAQPAVFTSIPATMWWAVATLSTMGIDMRPVTPLGKILASLIAVCGILLFALPAGIIGSGFVEKYMEARKGRICPHCGKSLEEAPASAPPAEDSGKRRG